WEGGEYADDVPPLDEFEKLARNIRSNFFSMDVAQTRSGEWIVIELGDGQVAGLPSPKDVEPFYKRLAQHIE
ncbi:MAG TPA: ATP-grasp domain-containing protein, partial [Abditibacteriaceae bacterium]|nr:ATP-grasp domain-containing protein [Abditibacteriaceae bacterium]